ncbi:hypothetical protein GE253_04465 [Niveispirillum sp. SYP-B3756]|uniref:hypothetical protein n=1 Tax=Niveispirillum sp. SYP-B3756 TaxID=2662178 RepID=UPI0012917E94|nr:hypothetical protein [Niveispirillum sp. SYP-B3756]MQP64594.1 hypothetical protein [Niveispirillum sp. SYP-B3756]
MMMLHRLSAALAALLLVPAALAGSLVLVEARGVAMAPGTQVPDDKPLTLPDGAQMVLIAEDGSQITLRGPFSGIPAKEAGSQGGTVQALADLMGARATDTSALGAARDAGQPPPLPEPWLIDAGASGSGCLRPGHTLVLWRAAAQKRQKLTLMPADRSWTANATWPAGEQRLALPDLPVQEGATFLLELDGNAAAITFHHLPDAVTARKMVGGWLLARGCDRQAHALLKG